jgi:hypothetical protein
VRGLNGGYLLHNSDNLTDARSQIGHSCGRGHLVRRTLLGLLCHSQTTDNCAEFGGMITGRGTVGTRRESTAVSVRSPQIPHGFTRDWSPQGLSYCVARFTGTGVFRKQKAHHTEVHLRSVLKQRRRTA